MSEDAALMTEVEKESAPGLYGLLFEPWSGLLNLMRKLLASASGRALLCSSQSRFPVCLWLCRE